MKTLYGLWLSEGPDKGQWGVNINSGEIVTGTKQELENRYRNSLLPQASVMAYCWPQYEVVRKSDEVYFAKEVGQYLFDGWELHGSPFIAINGDFCQALVRLQYAK